MYVKAWTVTDGVCFVFVFYVFGFLSFFVIIIIIMWALDSEVVFVRYEWWVRQFKESVRQFAQENIAPHAAAIDANNTFPQVADLTPRTRKSKSGRRKNL